MGQHSLRTKRVPTKRRGVEWNLQRTKLIVSIQQDVISMELTLVGVAVGALVGLGSVVTLVQTLVPTVDGNSVVGGEVPGLLGRSGE
jgi:hypothetical protein